MENVFRLFFDLTANGGWNVIAIMTYSCLILVALLAIYERKAG